MRSKPKACLPSLPPILQKRTRQRDRKYPHHRQPENQNNHVGGPPNTPIPCIRRSNSLAQYFQLLTPKAKQNAVAKGKRSVDLSLQLSSLPDFGCYT